MKKRWMAGAVAAGGMVIGLAGGVQAENYKPAAKAAVMKALEEFYGVEQGNKVTMYSMTGLMSVVNRAFDTNQVEEAKEPGAGSREPGAKGMEQGVKAKPR